MNDRADLLPWLRVLVARASQGLSELVDVTGLKKSAFSRSEQSSSMLRLTFGQRSALDAR